MVVGNDERRDYMDKVYVVKSVNVDEKSVILPDCQGIGVFLTYEDAKRCFDMNVRDLKELYQDNDPDDYDIYEEKDGECEDCYFYYRNPNTGYEYSDYVALYQCKIGQWEGKDLKEYKC